MNQLVQETNSSSTFYVQQEADYNVTSLTDASGDVVERYVYDPDGNVTVMNTSAGVLGNSLADSAFGNTIGFQGMPFSTSTGMYYTDTRVYSPTLGTFMTQDPTGANGSWPGLYAFCGDNSVGSVDPSGKKTFELNRKIGACADEQNVVRSNYNLYSHTFVYTAHKDNNGKWVLDHTYSWGNQSGLTSWHKDQPEDINAANQAIAQNYMGWEENAGDGSDLDAYIESTYQQFINSSVHNHLNFLVTNNCKDEAGELEFWAQDNWRVAHHKASWAFNHAVLLVGE